MKRIAFFDTKSYDKDYFSAHKDRFDIKFFENKLSPDTAALAAGFDGVIAFVNDEISAETIRSLYDNGIRVIALRGAGYNQVDLRAARDKITILRVPAYSPPAVAEHAAALLLTLNRKIHKAYNRTRDFDFRLQGLVGFDLAGKTAGIVGTGKIGLCFARICQGFSMEVLAYDPYPNADSGLRYVGLEELLAGSDIVSLHCPLTEGTLHMLDAAAFARMKPTAVVINTSRGGLVDSRAMLAALREKRIGGAALDVYEEEGDLFFEDFSQTGIDDEVLSLLVTLPNVLITSHQGFLTREALSNIAAATADNLTAFFEGRPLTNEVRWRDREASGGEPPAG